MSCSPARAVGLSDRYRVLMPVLVAVTVLIGVFAIRRHGLGIAPEDREHLQNMPQLGLGPGLAYCVGGRRESCLAR